MADLDPARLNGHDAVIALRATERQQAHVRARSLALVAVIAHCPPGDGDSPVERLPVVSQFAAEEVRCALTLTRGDAKRLLSEALGIVEKLPQVHDALSAGRIDRDRAWTIVDRTSAMRPDQRRAVADAMLEQAPGWTNAQLRDAVNRAVMEVDAQAGRARYQMSVDHRRLVCRTLPGGTGVVSGLDLPVDAAVAAAGVLDTLARAAKQAGDPRTLDQLRADLFLERLLGGPPEGSEGSSGEDATPSASVATPSLTVHLHADLTTLMGLDDGPAHVAGWGPVIADIARHLARDHAASWRWRVVDGETVRSGKTTARPAPSLLADVRSRDLTCRFPGCQAPAHRADVDHTVAQADGGQHVADNLGVLCRRCHRAKHEGGWRLTQSRPGHFKWISPLSHQYVVFPHTHLPP